jgi:hypothetical protein
MTRFDGRVLAFGLSHNRVRWKPSLGPALAAAVVGAPLRVYRDGSRLRHPRERGADQLDRRGQVGRVAAATATASEVLASLEIFDTRFAEGLLALEREGRLARAIGLSLLADVLYRPTVELGQAVRLVTWIRGVVAVDVVTDPSAGGAVLKSVA